MSDIAYRIVTQLRQLGDVNAPSPTNNQVLAYDSGTGKWVNTTVSSAILPDPLEAVVEDMGGAVYNAKAYGASGDVVYLTDAAINASATLLTSASASFTSADVGKAVVVAGAGAAGVALVTTIASRVSATQVNLTASASTSVTGARATYGTDNTSAFTSLLTTLASAPYGTVVIPPGIYAITAALPVKAYVAVQGMAGATGLGVTLVQFTDNADGFTNTTGTRIFNAEFTNVRLERAPGTSGGKGFNLTNVDRSAFSGCNVTENNRDGGLFQYGYWIYSDLALGSYHLQFYNCRARVMSTGAAWYGTGSAAGASCNQMHIWGGEARCDSGTAVYLEKGCNGVSIIGLSIEGTTSIGIDLVGEATALGQVLVQGCRFEMNSGTVGVRLDTNCVSCWVSGNTFASGVATKVIDNGLFNFCEYTGSLWDLRISRGDFRLKNGKFQTQGSSAEAYWAVTALGDANPVWSVKTSGRMNWGSGGASATDVTLYRGATGSLSLETGRWADAARTFADGDTTPSVVLGNVYATANTAPTTITSFTNGTAGQRLIVRVDANTTIANNSSIKLSGGTSVTGAANFCVAFQNISSVWYEIGRTTGTIAVGTAISGAGNNAILFTDGSGLLDTDAAEFGYNTSTNRFVFRGGGTIGTTTLLTGSVVVDGTNTSASSSSTAVFLDCDVAQTGSGASIGVRAQGRQNFAGTTASVNAFYGSVRTLNASSVVTAAYNYEAASPSITAGGAITTSYGIRIRQQKISGVTTGYGVYQDDAGDKNYFGGVVGIGTASPTSVLHLAWAQPSSVGTTPGTDATAIITGTGAIGGDTTIATTGTGGVGSAFTFTAGTGGQATAATTASTGGVGGAWTTTAGTGGAATVSGSGTNTGGVGGAITLTAGAGGAANSGGTNNAGAGGTVTIDGGQGGVGTTTSGNGGAIFIRGGGAAAAVGSNGGGINIQGRAGSSTGSGGGGGTVAITGGAAGGDDTVNRGGGSVTLTAGASKGSSVGGLITLTSGLGGAGTGATAANGGSITFNPGNGGNSLSTGSATGGVGGGLNYTGGTGGTASNATVNSTGGLGGDLLFTSGTGGAATAAGSGTNAGGAGGVVQFVGGTGGAASNGGTSNAGGVGGNVSLTGGQGGVGTTTSGSGGTASLSGGLAAAGAGSAGGQVVVQGRAGSSTGSGGAGGAVTITGGAAGGDNTVNRVGGAVTITAGASKGSISGASITITAGAGGPGTGTAGADAGGVTVSGGTGGVGSSTSGSGGNVLLVGGTAAAQAGALAGGSATVRGGVASTTGSGGPGGLVQIQGTSAGGDNTVSRAGGNVTITSGDSKGSAAGGAITVTAGTGGPGTGTAGAAGGAVTITGGTGGVGSSTGGTGGTVSVTGGTAAAIAGAVAGSLNLNGGVPSTTGSGGQGGGVSLSASSAGGDNTVDRAGGTVSITAGNAKGSATGGTITITSGTGGPGTGTAGAAGGLTTVLGGTGGNGSATGGVGGGTTIQAGSGGIGGGTTGAAGGTLVLRGGLGGTSAANGAGGNVWIQTADTNSYVNRFVIANTGAATYTGGSVTTQTAFTINTGADANSGLAITGNSGTQSGNLLTLNQSGSTALMTVTPAGVTTHNVRDAATNASTTGFVLDHFSSGTVADNFGTTVQFKLQSSTTASQSAGSVVTTWATATHASRKSRTVFNADDTATRECLRIEASGTAAMIGFLGAAAIAQYNTTGTTTGFTAGAGTNVTDQSTFTGNTGAAAYTLGDVVRALKQYGLLAS